MNMKKLMAVVLAVVLAISAMAVTAFAGEAEVKRIDIYNLGREQTNYRTSTWEFNLPIYNLYGYANQDSYLELKLPEALLNGTNCEIKWSIVVNGQSFGLKKTEGNVGWGAAPAGQIQYVNFGALTHSYFEANGVDNWATIPQTVNFNEINTIKLVAEVKLPSTYGYDPTWATNANELKYNMWVQLWTAGANGIKEYGAADSDDQKVTGSVTYAANMDITKTGGENTSYFNDFRFVSDENNVVYTKSVSWGGYDTVVRFPIAENGNYAVKADDSGKPQYGMTLDGLEVELPVIDPDAKIKKDILGNDIWADYAVETIVPLTWDHTLENRSYILAAESAKLVVELKDPMYGVAYYSLYAADTKTTQEETQLGNGLWWQSGWTTNRKQTFVQTVFVNGNATSFEFDVPVSALVNGTYGIGNVAAGMNGEFRIYRQFETDKTGFQDQGWRYAYNNNDINYRYIAKSIYLLLTMPVDENGDDVEVKDPVESNNPDEEEENNDNVNVEEPKDEQKPADKNPPTGIVLAVLPMVVAAAAVVASKRR